MKKIYQVPSIKVAEFELTQMLAASVTGTTTNLGEDDDLGYGGGGSGPAHARQRGMWDDDEEDYGW